VASEEASSHTAFKQAVIHAAEGDTKLSLKKLTPVRMLKNKFFEQVEQAENRGADVGELKEILGRARAKQGMHEGNLDEGELEIGQVSALLNDILPAGKIVQNMWQEFKEATKNPIIKYNFTAY
jgi:enoyl-[acyl-carrier protein] reductase II